MTKKYIIVQTHTNKKDLTDEIAKEMISRRLVSCVNVYPETYSLYRYNNKLIQDREYLLHAKTTEEKFEEIKVLIEELHNYETPEIISLEILDGNEKYMKWIENEII
mgnify:FL=1